MEFIPVYQPSLTGNEKKYVNECLDTSWISAKGKFVQEFESAFEKYIGADHAITVANGTVALHLALIALGIGNGDEVIVPTLTYVASVNAIAYTGATPVFVDSLKGNWQVDSDDIERKITEKTKAIMVVHLYGHPCDMTRIMKIARKHDLFVVEDCAEAFGSYFEGQHVGTFGDISTFSFYGNKTITTGEGGMVVTNDETLYARATHLKDQGMAKFRQYWHDVIGYNYRMSNICAGIGRGQMTILDEHIAHHQRLAACYREAFKNVEGVTFHDNPTAECDSNFWLNTILLSPEVKVKGQENAYSTMVSGAIGGAGSTVHQAKTLHTDCEPNANVEALRVYLDQHGVESRPLWKPMHKQPVYQNNPAYVNGVSEELFHQGLCLPSGPMVSEEDVAYIIGLIKEAIQ